MVLPPAVAMALVLVVPGCGGHEEPNLKTPSEVSKAFSLGAGLSASMLRSKLGGPLWRARLVLAGDEDKGADRDAAHVLIDLRKAKESMKRMEAVRAKADSIPDASAQSFGRAITKDLEKGAAILELQEKGTYEVWLYRVSSSSGGLNFVCLKFQVGSAGELVYFASDERRYDSPPAGPTSTLLAK